jgi:DNA-binding NarL/FixJ family response regulator
LLEAANHILQDKSDLWISDALKNKTGINFQSKLHTSITLSQTEHQIFQLLREGKSEQEIADQLDFSLDRVKRYIRVLLVKYEVDTVQELIRTG